MTKPTQPLAALRAPMHAVSVAILEKTSRDDTFHDSMEGGDVEIRSSMISAITSGVIARSVRKDDASQAVRSW